MEQQNRLNRQRLAELYARFDAFQCLGKCQIFCSKVHFTPIEWSLLSDKRMAKHRPARESEAIMRKRQNEVNWLGERIDTKDNCEYLSPIGTCEIYNERPFNCRSFGAVADNRMVCKWGCKPIMNTDEYMDIIHQYMDVLCDPDALLGTDERRISMARIPIKLIPLAGARK